MPSFPQGRGEDLRSICEGVPTDTAPDSGWTELQHVVMSAMCEALSGIGETTSSPGSAPPLRGPTSRSAPRTGRVVVVESVS